MSVLVVGAGPVGLVLACELARRGVGIRLIDKRAEPTDESRAILVHARSLELMERVGVVDELIATGVRTTAMEFHADGQTIARLELDTVDSPFPFSLSTAQTETERILTERLDGLGVSVDRGVELVGFEQDEDQVRARLQRADGREETVVASFLAGTDGSHSAVREIVGTKLEGSFKGGERFLLGDVDGRYTLDRDSMHSFFSAGAGPLLIFPMRGGRLRVIAQIDPGADMAMTTEAVQQVCDERAGGIEVTSSHWITIFEIHHAQVPSYRFGRAFLAGDAAHIHSPAGGQGMNTGMQDAFNLGWKLALASAGQAGPGLLDSYHDERHPVAARVIKQTTRLTTAGTLRHPLARELRNHALGLATALAPVQHVIADQMEETDIAYRDSPIVGPSDRRKGPQPGHAAPDVPGIAPALHTALAEATGHTALYVAGANEMPTAPAAGGGLRRLLVAASDPGTFDGVLIDPERRVAARYGIGKEGGLVLVRPDGYIGLRASLDDEAAVASYLASVTDG